MQEAVQHSGLFPGGCSQSEEQSWALQSPGCLCQPRVAPNPSRASFGAWASQEPHLCLGPLAQQLWSFMVSTHSFSFWCSYLFLFYSLTQALLIVWVPFVRMKDQALVVQCSLFRNTDRHCKPISKSENHFKYSISSWFIDLMKAIFLTWNIFFKWLSFFYCHCCLRSSSCLVLHDKNGVLSSAQKTKQWTKVSQPWHCPPRVLNSPTKSVSITLPFPNPIQNISSKGSSGLGSWSQVEGQLVIGRQFSLQSFINLKGMQ